jgi:hypothetical protein
VGGLLQRLNDREFPYWARLIEALSVREGAVRWGRRLQEAGFRDMRVEGLTSEQSMVVGFK